MYIYKYIYIYIYLYIHIYIFIYILLNSLHPAIDGIDLANDKSK